MKKDKLNFIVYKYSCDTGFFELIIISIALCIFLIFGIFESLLFLFPVSVIVIFTLYMIIKILIIKNKVSKNDIESINLINAKAYIKETKETDRCGAILIKLYVVDENKKIFNICCVNEAREVLKNARIVGEGGNIQCPTLLFSSNGEDQEKDWVENQQKFAMSMGAKLIGYDCGHYIHHFKSDEMCEEIIKFINSLER